MFDDGGSFIIMLFDVILAGSLFSVILRFLVPRALSHMAVGKGAFF